MKYFFYLQYQMLRRKVVEFGLRPLTALILVVGAFLGFSWLLFLRGGQHAGWVYAMLALLPQLSQRSAERDDFLRSTYPPRKYRNLLLLENLILCLPFALFLLLQGAWLPAIALAAVAAALSRIRPRGSAALNFPTPYSTLPFEFARGFRLSWPFYFFIIFLLFMAVLTPNANLGAFALLLIFPQGAYFYFEPEDPYWVWIYADTPASFLQFKIRLALMQANLTALPAFLILLFFFPDQILLLFGMILLGSLWLITTILAKYSVFPGKMQLPQELILMAAIFFPPSMLLSIPWLFGRARKNLQTLLS